jgi:hypothetical protein
MTTLLIAFAFVCLLGLGHALSMAAHAVCTDRRQNRRTEEKARALLRAWLTPQQANQWDSRKEFEVIGSHTGTRYRIRRATAMNVDELDSRGKVVTQWCFGPQGELAVGDVMLAQKIALETMEWNALASANRRVLRR